MADYGDAFEVYTKDGAVSTKAKRVHLLDKAGLPPPYRTNSHKEELCLEYVDNFNRQFVQLFPQRKSLWLHPKNECDVTKFVCTTVRPTQLTYKELYDLGDCSSFVSSFFEYEPLENPTKPPECLPSPTSVLKWQTGDCFDISVVLCSYLLGAGYDAYCVSGYAPRWVCLRDQSKQVCPLIGADKNLEEKSSDDNEEKTEKRSAHYRVRPRGVPASKFLKHVEEQRQIAEEKAAKDEESDDEPEPDAADPLEGERVHCWVLVLAGKRGVSDNLFVEPTTGRVWKVHDSPYLGVESVWNNANYWVNMQEGATSTAHIAFDLGNSDQWEYVFIDTMQTLGDGVAEDSDSDLDDDDVGVSRGDDKRGGDGDERILDIPPSWVRKLTIPREAFAKRYWVTGQKTELYWKAKLELFAEHMHAQGMVSRLTRFRDAQRTVPLEVREKFVNRRDKLVRRTRYPLDGRVVEDFDPGRTYCLRQHVDITGKRREFHFYTSARLDGLVKREENIGKKIIEVFESRDDQLTYRSVTVNPKAAGAGDTKSSVYTLPGGQLGDLIIRKMCEKFGRSDETEGSETDVARRVYYIKDGSMRVLYHYAKGRITASSRVYYKDRSIPVEVVQVDPFAARPKPAQFEEEFQNVLSAEKDCYAAVRDSERETQEILQMRKREEARVVLDKSIFETAREKAKDDTKKDNVGEEAEEKDERQVDYLNPFLQNVADPKNPSRDEAQSARDSCLKALKERLLERANIIQRRLDEENAQLAKKQAAFQRSRDHVEGADEEFEKFCSEAMFRIQILEQRLARHEETALQKYADMDFKLRSDPRLNALNA